MGSVVDALTGISKGCCVDYVFCGWFPLGECIKEGKCWRVPLGNKLRNPI